MVDAIISMPEYNRYSKGIFGFVGFNTKWIEFENKERVAGYSKWSFWKLFGYAIEGITAFSTTPLVLSAFIGIIFCMIAFFNDCGNYNKNYLFWRSSRWMAITSMYYNVC